MSNPIVGLRLPPEIREQLEKIALAQDLSLSQVIRKALREYLEGLKNA